MFFWNLGFRFWYLQSNVYICTHICWRQFASARVAGMVKLVDMPDLGSGAARRVGSSPITRTF